MCAQNFAHVHVHTNFARNHEICVQAQIGSARGRCSNTLVFFLIMLLNQVFKKVSFQLLYLFIGLFGPKASVFRAGF